jgi:DNA-binding CsgD family transcriptional regulator
MTVSFTKPVVCPILIGRTPDLAALHLLAERAKSGQGQVALLSGEAGIGKSRLVTELKTSATAQGFQLLQGNCFPTDFSCPYAPLLDLLRSVFITSSTAKIASDVGPIAREFAPLLPDVVQKLPDLTVPPPLPSLDPEQEKRRLFATLAHFFLSQAAHHPLLLIVEDLHWSDETSLEFLHYLARRCTAYPLLVLLTYRSDEVHPSLSHFLAQLDRERLVSLAQHDVTRAESLLNAALGPDDPAQTVGQRLVWYARAELALARNDPPLALHITDQLLASAVGLSSESSIPRLSKLRGEALTKLKQAAEAETILQQARVTALKHGLRPLLWRIYLTQGKLAHSQRRYEEAERRFAEALEMLEDLANSLPDETLQQHFLRHAHALFPHTRQPSPHRLTKKTFEGLTERERAVAALIARGKSNREIVDSLVVAPRTIETHISSILSKLDFTSRTQIAIWATEKGLSNDAM